jgi:hypothetical protein
MRTSSPKNIARDVVASYATTSQLALVGSILGFGLIGVTPAQAANFYNYSGTTIGAPTWNRPDANGDDTPIGLSDFATATPYSTFAFNIDTSGFYTVNVNANNNSFDPYAVLYQGSFDPNTPLLNAVIANDDGGPGQNSQFTTSLTSGTNYFLVTTGYDNDDFGNFTNTIKQSVPEPFTIVGTLIGGTAALRMRKKLADSAKV